MQSAMGPQVVVSPCSYCCLRHVCVVYVCTCELCIQGKWQSLCCQLVLFLCFVAGGQHCHGLNMIVPQAVQPAGCQHVPACHLMAGAGMSSGGMWFDRFLLCNSCSIRWCTSLLCSKCTSEHAMYHREAALRLWQAHILLQVVRVYQYVDAACASSPLTHAVVACLLLLLVVHVLHPVGHKSC